MLAQLPTALRDLQLPLRLKLWDGKQVDLGPKPQVTLVVKDPSLVSQLAHPSLDALGAAYVEGRVELEGPIEAVIEVGDALSSALLGDDSAPVELHTAHDKRSDAEAIRYHYDLSNEFYRLWLDRDMVYSCAYFETGEESLDQAQQAKMRHLCRKLRLQPGDKLLDVGCGWGGLARFAAREFEAEVYGITLSKAQLELGLQRVAEEGLSERVTLELLDYRDLPQDGRFDKVVSVGMFEHVGHANLALYCQRLFGAVRPGGLVMNHGITARFTDGRPGRRRIHRPLRIPTGRAAASGDHRHGDQRSRAGDRRCREPAPALCAHPAAMEPGPGTATGQGRAVGAGQGPAHLAPVPGRLRLRLPAWLDEPAPDSRGEAARGRQP